MARRKLGLLHSPYLPLVTFTTFTLGGCLFIAVAKTSGASPFVSMAVPVLLMFTYLILSVAAGKLRMHDEQAGDNLYYMGFLYTLSSLGVSLYQFGTGTSTDEVVRNFGIAITSTIVGIALRILYNQMRRDPADIERAARHELADMTRRVRAEMENVTREFADFRRVSNQMLEEGFQEIATQAEKNGEHIRDILNKLALEAIKPVQDASKKLGAAMQENFEQIENQFGEIARKVGAAGQHLDDANASMSLSTAKLGTQADNVAEKLEKVVIPDEVLKNELAPLVKTLSQAVAQYAIKTEHAAKEQNERLQTMGQMLKLVVDAAGKTATAVEKSTEATAAQQHQIAALAEAMSNQSRDTHDMVAKVMAIQASDGTASTPKSEPWPPTPEIEIASDNVEVPDQFENIVQPPSAADAGRRGWSWR